ncbi:hypothetical protein K3495_g5751 [Podosphaera aphanis]|nr:hypothetical protein K3495_g5751 [Podosphaera aphanis]
MNTISTESAFLLLLLYTLIYVLPFYLFPHIRPSPVRPRDAPSVIRGRIRSVTLSCIICSLTTFIIITYNDSHGSCVKSLHLMGYYPLGITKMSKSILLTATLFIGPIFERGFVDSEWRGWIRLKGLNSTLRSWTGWRNYVAGPITEEVLFRSASVPLLLISPISTTKIIWLTPIIFGLAHLHHFYEFRVTHPDSPIIIALLRSILQFTYTTAFGAFATFVYLRTGCLLSVIVIHSFCNWMGLPRLWGAVGEGYENGEDINDAKRLGTSFLQRKIAKKYVYTTLYYVLLIAGAISWSKLLWPLTEHESTQ